MKIDPLGLQRKMVNDKRLGNFQVLKILYLLYYVYGLRLFLAQAATTWCQSSVKCVHGPKGLRYDGAMDALLH